MNLNEMFSALDSNKNATPLSAREREWAANQFGTGVETVEGVKAQHAKRDAAADAAIARNNAELAGEGSNPEDETVIVESPKVAAENAKRAKAGKPKMTAAEAVRFEMYSEKNASIVEEAAADRGCECEAYVSIFTFNRWIAQGRVVKKGEKATFVQVPNFREIVDDKTGEKRKIKIGERRVAVFCKCQTKKLEAKGRAA